MGNRNRDDIDIGFDASTPTRRLGQEAEVLFGYEETQIITREAKISIVDVPGHGTLTVKTVGVHAHQDLQVVGAGGSIENFDLIAGGVQ